MSALRNVYVIGSGMTRFAKSDSTLKQLAAAAVDAALRDAGADVGGLQAAYVGNAVAGLTTGQEMIRGQVLLRPLGIEKIPIINVENACASASTALHLGWQAIASGLHDVVLCLGAEKLATTDKSVGMAAIGTAVDLEARAEMESRMGTANGSRQRSFFMDLYADMTRRYMEVSGATPRHFAQVVVKNQRNGALNPRAQYGGDYTEEQVLAAREIVWPLTLLMCSPISDGAAAVVLGSAQAMRRLGRKGPRIRASVLVSGNVHDRDDPSAGSAGRAACLAFQAAGIGPDDIDCAEIHDATAPAELMIYEQMGFAPAGGGPALLESGRTSPGGSLVVNPSGGLLCKGHPIGATGIAQVCEAVWQLRGEAGARQVAGARSVLTQNGGGWLEEDSAAMSVHILTRD